MPRLENSKWKIVNGNRKSILHSPLTIHNQGFTLIELLIVITIIGILATLILASFGGAQAKARDGRRKSDLAQIKRGMELAKSDCKGSAYYPYLGGSTAVDAYNNLSSYLSDSDLKHMSSAPKDPKDSAPQQYAYGGNTPAEINKCPNANGSGTLDVNGVSDYAIWVVLERTSDADATDSRTACNGKPTPGASPWTDNAAYVGYYVICNN